jgi:hypothetical protein
MIKMAEKRLYKLMSKETGCTIGWFTDSQDMFHLIDWYDVDTKYEVYKLEEVVE